MEILLYAAVGRENRHPVFKARNTCGRFRDK